MAYYREHCRTCMAYYIVHLWRAIDCVVHTWLWKLEPGIIDPRVYFLWLYFIEWEKRSKRNLLYLVQPSYRLMPTVTFFSSVHFSLSSVRIEENIKHKIGILWTQLNALVIIKLWQDSSLWPDSIMHQEYVLIRLYILNFARSAESTYEVDLGHT